MEKLLSFCLLDSSYSFCYWSKPFNQFRITLNLVSIIIFTKPLVNHDEHLVTLMVDLINTQLCVLDLLVLHLTLCQWISLISKIWNFSFIVQPSCMIPSFCPIETWAMRNSPYLVNSWHLHNNRNIQTSIFFHTRHCKDK